MEFLESLNGTVVASSLHSRGLFKPTRDDGLSRLWSQRSPRSNLHVLGDQVQSFLFLMTQCIYSLYLQRAMSHWLHFEGYNLVEKLGQMKYFILMSEQDKEK